MSIMLLTSVKLTMIKALLDFKDHSHLVGRIATTVAHEMGHNFGMTHDTEESKCPEEKCIMSPSSG